MPSIKIELPANTWVDVSQGNASGTITHYAGYSDIYFVQATNVPSLSPPIANAIADTLDPDKETVKYYSGLLSERIWACSTVRASTIVATESEV